MTVCCSIFENKRKMYNPHKSIIRIFYSIRLNRCLFHCTFIKKNCHIARVFSVHLMQKTPSMSDQNTFTIIYLYQTNYPPSFHSTRLLKRKLVFKNAVFIPTGWKDTLCAWLILILPNLRGLGNEREANLQS